MRRLIAAATMALLLIGCSSNVQTEQRGENDCYSERTETFLGIEYSREQNKMNCP